MRGGLGVGRVYACCMKRVAAAERHKKKGPDWVPFLFGAGNGTSTDALSVCFPTLFFAEGLNEGLNFSLVFGRRQRRPSTNFHSPPTPSAHLRATPCRGSPLHRVRVRELSAHLSALHS